MENSATSHRDINDEIIDSLIKKVNELDKREIIIPDYTQNFKALIQWLEIHRPDYDKPIEELKTIVKQHIIEYPDRIQNHVEEIKNIVGKIPNEIPVKHHYHFDTTSKWWIAMSTALFIVAIASASLCVHLWVSNNKLKDNDIKFRMIRLIYPEQSGWAEHLYHKNPKEVEIEVVKMENEAIEHSAARNSVNQAKRKSKR